MYTKKLFKPEEISEARKVLLKPFFESKGVKLKKTGKGNFKIPGHGGFIIKDNYFYNHASDEKGSAIDAVIKILNVDFHTAVSELLNSGAGKITYENIKPAKTKTFFKPRAVKSQEKIYSYLVNTRKINARLVKKLIDANLLYQDTYGNCVFKTYYPKSNVTASYFLEGTRDNKRYKAFISKIDDNRKYGFRLTCCDSPERIYFFESIVDLLSYMEMKGIDKKAWYISMNGLLKDVIDQALIECPGICIHLCIDNVNLSTGARKFHDSLEDYSFILDSPLLKDFNDDLRKLKSVEK